MNTMKLPSFGQRIRYARNETGMSQSEFARAISHISKSRCTKSLVSQWEVGKVHNPQNATMMAICAITGFSQQWLVNNKGPEKSGIAPLKVAEPAAVYAPGLDRATLRRAILIAATEQKTPKGIADAAVEIFETLADMPDVPDAVLHRIARLSNSK